MASDALVEFTAAMSEIGDLQRANPSPTGAAPGDPGITRVVGRASVVLLSSHFERYHYAMFDEMITAVNDAGVKSSRIPKKLRLRHSRSAVDTLGGTEWSNREAQLVAFAVGEASLWQPDAVAHGLDSTRLLESMTAPLPEQLVRVYGLLGVENIFDAVTRKPHTRSELWLQIKTLVEKRNNIAHGDPSTQATQADVRKYRRATENFTERVDRLMPAVVKREFGVTLPW